MTGFALIGAGAIAEQALTALAGALPEPLPAVTLLMRPASAARGHALLDRFPVVARDRCVVTDTPSLIARRPDLVLEAAGHEAVADYGPDILAAGLALTVASVGALADAALHQRLRAAAQAGGGRVHLLPGAIGGLDVLAAAKLSGLKRVTYVSRKPPQAWRGSPAEAACDLAGLTEAFCFYSGTAAAAARDYPKNANVAATVALTGLGFERTEVKLIADPAVSANIHEIIFESAATAAHLRIEGRPSPSNPKTSALTGFSLARAVLTHFAQEIA